MAWTSADVEKLERAIASGTLTVRYQDRQVTYQSIDAMLRALKVMRAEVEPATRRRTFRMTQTGTGL